jgi:uncharacterized protein (TIGR00255 family)
MTGFAFRSFEYEDCTLYIEIKSLNNKFLEMRIKLPFQMEHFEEMIRGLVRQYVKRGKVDVSVRIVAKEQLEYNFVRSLLQKYSKIIKKLEEDTGYSLNMSVSELLSLTSFFNSYSDIAVVTIDEEVLRDAVVKTIDEFQESRFREGENTKEDIIEYVGAIVGSVESVGRMSPTIIEKYKTQLKDKINELVGGELDETRVLMEVAVYANKIDISEEISRIKGHLNKMLHIVEKDGSCGRELDFMSQEVNREINTIGAKVPDYTISEKVVDMKTNLEKIKEQVRNIE